MRARGLLLALALVASACSDTPRSERDNAGPTTTAVPSRVLGEPGESSDLSRDEAPEGIAFENDPSEDPDRSAGAPERATAAEEAAADATAEGSELGVGQEADATAAPSSAAAPLTELDLLIDELIAFVEAERGYSFKERPVVELLDNAAFGAAWTELIANDVVENRSDYDNYTDIYQTMGIIDDGSTLEQIWQRFGDAGVIGYYDPATGVITLRNGEVNAFTETVLVHELVHALEDQIFDLDRPEYGDDGGELSWTFSALTEGSARRIESAYRASFSSDQPATATAKPSSQRCGRPVKVRSMMRLRIPQKRRRPCSIQPSSCRVPMELKRSALRPPTVKYLRRACGVKPPGLRSWPT